MKIIVAYSGGKDSQAALIWSVKKYGAENVTAVFCDTGWEHSITYQHINQTCQQLNVKLIIVKSEKYEGMVDLAIKKGRFASTMARFCTAELKSIPFIDYVLKQTENLIIIQGIRAAESNSRSKMKKQCYFFKYYYEPYNDKGKTHTYRKKDVLAFKKKYNDDIIRPCFNWTGQQVIDYIVDNGQKPNDLYYQGFKRVGCFPCFMASHQEVKQIIIRYPHRFQEIIDIEEKVGNSFFKTEYIPERFRTGYDQKSGKYYTRAEDIHKYIIQRNSTMDMFDDGAPSCSSFYHLCE